MLSSSVHVCTLFDVLSRASEFEWQLQCHYAHYTMTLLSVRITINIIWPLCMNVIVCINILLWWYVKGCVGGSTIWVRCAYFDCIVILIFDWRLQWWYIYILYTCNIDYGGRPFSLSSIYSIHRWGRHLETMETTSHRHYRRMVRDFEYLGSLHLLKYSWLRL